MAIGYYNEREKEFSELRKKQMLSHKRRSALSGMSHSFRLLVMKCRKAICFQFSVSGLAQSSPFRYYEID